MLRKCTAPKSSITHRRLGLGAGATSEAQRGASTILKGYLVTFYNSKLLRSAAVARGGMQFLHALFKRPAMPCGGRGGGILQQFTLTTVYT